MIFSEESSMSVFWRLALWAIAVITWTACSGVHAESLPDDIATLQHGWARAYYVLPESQKESAFTQLEAQATDLVARNPGRAEPLVWQAIVQSSHAKFAGGLHALDLIKKARDHLLDAEKIDAKALDGSVYTSLGSLYAKAPGWPLSFGDRKKAKAYLEQALAINPQGIDPNFFYGELLIDQGHIDDGKAHLEQALKAPRDPDARTPTRDAAARSASPWPS
jgi:tetratricopeptide (TPR) repeat protein